MSFGLRPCLNDQWRCRAAPAAAGSSHCKRRVADDGRCGPRHWREPGLWCTKASSRDCPTGPACPTVLAALKAQL